MTFPAAAAALSPSISSSGTNPRGIKRARTPEQHGNVNVDGDRDDGTCALGSSTMRREMALRSVGGSLAASSHIDPL